MRKSHVGRFDGKVSFITGAATGIGAAIASRLCSEGAICILTDLDLQTATKTAETLVSTGHQAVAFKMDVTKSAEVDEVVGRSWNAYGKIDILINNAGVSTMNALVDLTEEEWDFNMDVNAKGVFLVTRATVRRMLAHDYSKCRPKIVNVASKAGKDPGTLLAHYAASKHAVVGFTKAVARELAPYKINVNCVCPGFVQTSMQEREIAWDMKLRGISSDQVKAEYLSKIPLGRLEKPEDVANVVAFLCSEDADYLTAQSINVDGGIVVF